MEKDIIGKQAKIIWEDKDRISQKEGVIQDISNIFTRIKTKKNVELILNNRILRIELEGGSGK